MVDGARQMQIEKSLVGDTGVLGIAGDGTLARTIDTDVDVDVAATVMDGLADVGVDMDVVGLTLEDQGVAGFHESFAHVLAAQDTKAHGLAAR